MSRFNSDLRAVTRRLGGKLPAALEAQLAEADDDAKRATVLAACRAAADKADAAFRKSHGRPEKSAKNAADEVDAAIMSEVTTPAKK